MAEYKKLIICECYSTEHQLIFLYDDDPDWDRIYVHTHLNKERSFWKRFIHGIKYIFGYRSMYGDFDEFIINPDDVDNFQQIATHLKKIKARETESRETESKENLTNRFSIGDEVELENEKVTIIEIIPHPDVKGSVYYKFSNGEECRDIRLKLKPKKGRIIPKVDPSERSILHEGVD